MVYSLEVAIFSVAGSLDVAMAKTMFSACLSSLA